MKLDHICRMHISKGNLTQIMDIITGAFESVLKIKGIKLHQFQNSFRKLTAILCFLDGLGILHYFWANFICVCDNIKLIHLITKLIIEK